MSVEDIIALIEPLSLSDQLKVSLALAKSMKSKQKQKQKQKGEPLVSDIDTFFTTSTKADNDATNKIREKVLSVLCNVPQEFILHPEFGQRWRVVRDGFAEALRVIALQKGIQYTSTQIKIKGGRGANYDAVVTYISEDNSVRKIEFKYGSKNICSLPQFLSLQAKFGLFSVTYDSFFWEKYLNKYLACDTGITEAKPTRDDYLKKVTGTVAKTPFFAQLKEREAIAQNEKNAVVNASITDYLNKYGKNIDLKKFFEKVKDTQTDKTYLLWSDGKFYIDEITEADMSNMTFRGIKNGNVLEVVSGNTVYGMLLRWRNHKGILNPAWQISMTRC